jgi:hypothetical protein
MEIHMGWLARQWRYIGFRAEADALGTKQYCFGLWWFHVYVDSGEHI